MSRLEVGKYWVERLGEVLPNASVRIRTRLAWHLAALDVSTDAELAALPEVALCRFNGGARHFLELRTLYLRLVRVPTAPAGGSLALAPYYEGFRSQ